MTNSIPEPLPIDNHPIELRKTADNRTRNNTRFHGYFPLNDPFIDTQIISSILLIVSATIAIIWATYPGTAESYVSFIHHRVGILWGQSTVIFTLQDIVNDILLTLFFFVVGLEIKREVLVGELSNHRTAYTILFSALGGIIVPACLYLLITHNTPLVSGWAIPTATDTAFAIGVLALFRKYIPPTAFIFLAALAVVDDIVGIAFIGAFYSENISYLHLLYALGAFSLLLLMNRKHVYHAWPYLLVGLLFWGLIEEAGVHGTIAGIFTALAIPSRSKLCPDHFFIKMRSLLRDIKISDDYQRHVDILRDCKQHSNLENLEHAIKQATTPLLRWEHKLEFPVLLLVLPLFALTNAGIHINLALFHDLSNHVLGSAIILSLVVGKPGGILLFTYLSQKCKLGTLPGNLTIKDIVGPALLAGMGFTMSLFITDLNFEGDPMHMEIAKLAIVVSSLLSAILGSVWILKHRL